MTRKLSSLTATLVLALLLSGCGIKGSLATPRPILSKDAPVDAVQAEEDTEDALDEEEPFYGPDFKDPLNGDLN